MTRKRGKARPVITPRRKLYGFMALARLAKSDPAAYRKVIARDEGRA
jgi:hypothetical protein